MDNAPAQQKYNVQKLRSLLRDRFVRFLGRSRKRRVPLGPAHRMLPLWESDVAPTNATSDWTPAFSHDYVNYAIQLAVYDVFRRLYARGWNAYVVGGTLRDLMVNLSRNGSRNITPRDIDVVVSAPSLQDLESCFPADLIQRRTRFGGLHLLKKVAEIGEVHFDVWPLADTWAFRTFGGRSDISNFPFTPFLNLDAIAIEAFPTDGRTPKLFERGFFQGITSQLVDINFRPNPFPDTCAVRALIVAAKLQFSLSRDLALFVCSRVERPALINRFRDAQLSHYGQVRCSAEELSEWIESIRHQLEAGADRIEIKLSRARQLELWADYPPSEADQLGNTPADGSGSSTGAPPMWTMR